MANPSSKPLFDVQLLHDSSSKLRYTVTSPVTKVVVKLIVACNQYPDTDYYLYYSVTSNGASEIVLANKILVQKVGGDPYKEYTTIVLLPGDAISFWADTNAKIGLGAWGIIET
jgi:hypothetical protein